MVEYAAPPTLLRDVIADPGEVVDIMARNAPYMPLGGWYRPDADAEVADRALWFQHDWVHADMKIPGSEIFLDNPQYHEAAKAFYDSEVILPHSLYMNMMVAIDAHGPAHTDNPKFRGRERKNTPMWLLRSMLWSGLFERWEIVQATSIWWLDDVEEGGLAYWAEGPDKPPHRHVGEMANTALLGDNHRMFHQVERVGPFDKGTLMVTPRAQVAPEKGVDGDWVVRDRGEEVFRAPLSSYRVSILWKADVYKTEAEYRELQSDTLSMQDVKDVFDKDLEERGEPIRLDLERLEEPEHQAAIAAVYPEATPVGAGVSVYDKYRA